MGTHAERVAINDDVSRDGPGRVRAGEPPEGDRRHRRRPVRRRAGAGHGPRRQGPRDRRRRRRGAAPRHDARGAGPAQARLRPARRRGPRRRDGRHGHRRQRARASPTAPRRRSSPASAPSSGSGSSRSPGSSATPRPRSRRSGCSSRPIEGVRRLLDRIELPIEAFDLIEINEAFAAQTLADGRELGFDWDKVNVNGGAIALGHPIGASGARIVATLLHELARREGRYGLATLCLGGGGSVATAFERV